MRVRLDRTTERRSDPWRALSARVFAANVTLIVGSALVIGLSPMTLGWPLTRVEALELSAWVLAAVLVEFLLVRFLFQRRRARPRPRDPHAELTPREAEIVQLIAESFTTKEIAETLSISPKTVDAHRAHILKKLGLRDRVALTRYAIRRGLVQP